MSGQSLIYDALFLEVLNVNVGDDVYKGAMCLYTACLIVQD